MHISKLDEVYLQIEVDDSLSKELADFCYQYFLNKRAVARHLFDDKFLSPYTTYFGVWNDAQIPETYSSG